MGATLDLAGASSFTWKQQHVVGHHAFTNVDGLDPDIRVTAGDVRRFAPSQPWHPWHALQHVYLSFLYCLLAAKGIFVDDFVALATGRMGPVPLAPMGFLELALLWGGKAAYAAYMLALPLVYSPHSGLRLLALWAVMDAATGWMLALMFQVAHVIEGVAYHEADATTRKVPAGWAAAQVAATADFCGDSWFWSHFSGGLNHQIEHHLFPGVCHCHYRALAPMVKRTAAEFGVPYKEYPTFGAALAAHFRHLRDMGAHTGGVPTLNRLG
jgi:fatty acid desaturase